VLQECENLWIFVAGPIPTIQELEAEEAKDDDAEFVFGDDADAETGMQATRVLLQQD